MGEYVKALGAEGLRLDNKSLRIGVSEFTKRIQAPYLNLKPEDRRLVLQDSLTSLVHDPDLARQFLSKQVGGDTWQLSAEEQQDLPDRALIRLQESFNKRSESLWPFLVWRHMPKEAEEYVAAYKWAAYKTGGFPYPASLEAVPFQRSIDWRYRTLAAQLMFTKSYIDFPDVQAAGSPYLAMIAKAGESYRMHSEEELQQAILAKAKNLTEEKIKALVSDGMWNDKDDLAYMCTDKGLRELVLTYYGIFRRVLLPKLSGYVTGQDLLLKKSVLHRCLRVAA
jgi:hypothetical protein